MKNFYMAKREQGIEIKWPIWEKYMYYNKNTKLISYEKKNRKTKEMNSVCRKFIQTGFIF